MAGLAIGFWNSKEEIKALRALDVIFNCKMDSKERDKLYKGWKEAVRRTSSNY
jgi:glycerol kinase